jgi:hypothetical protein
MLVHLFNLILRSIEAMPSAVGSNWLGVLYPLLLFALTEGLSVLFFGWLAVKQNWGKTVGVGFAVVGVFWTGLFLWCAVKTTYTDHQQLAERVTVLHKKVADTEFKDATHLAEVSQDLNGQIGVLKQECAFKEGQNSSLLNQNRDQQSTINNCQTQAIKLLAPVPLKITEIRLWDDPAEERKRTAQYLVLDNQSITPVRLLFRCDRIIEHTETAFAGGGQALGETRIIQESNLHVDVNAPAFSPDTPLLVKITYLVPVGMPSGITCGIEQR